MPTQRIGILLIITARLLAGCGDSAGVVYDTPIMINPEPELQASLHPGGQIEGWFTLQVAQGEADIVLVFEPLFDFEGVNTRYIALE